jgi:uncharacterized protein YidB (DUF937 family)
MFRMLLSDGEGSILSRYEVHMGLLEDLAGKAIGAASTRSPAEASIASEVLQMVNRQPGGLSGLVQLFHEKGLGGLINSWISTGQNLPVSSGQLQDVLGSDHIKQLAAKVGISPDAAGSVLAQILPTVVDRLTPQGRITG